ncbi:MAG: hypothetical protein JOZ51_19075 [Chloroflexi bacterium]|nr:hypothetical protein [Chloroflexota bacterium]
MLPDEEKTLEIARRTRKNLDFIYAQKAAGSDVEEFTHLLNSMLGMVICLREEYFKGTSVTWEDVQVAGLSPVEIISSPPTDASPSLKQHQSFNQLISCIRHAFAHNNFELLGDSENRITGIKVWNIGYRKENEPENREWEAIITEQQLKDLAYLFINYVENQFGRPSAALPRSHRTAQSPAPRRS